MDVSHVDLPQLYNESLPAEVVPTMYNFHLYEQVMLCPAGLENPWAILGVRPSENWV
jgi:hypothetical protein